MYDVELSQDIAAPPDRVWDVLTAFREYDEWNPVITRMRATLSAHTPVSFVIAVGGRELKIKAEMLNVEHGRELRWHGPTAWLLARLFHGEHYVRVEPAGVGKSRLIHGERFGGASVPLLWRRMKRDLEKAYGEMNRAVKARAESSWAGHTSGSGKA
jgi:hypothetical protein